MALGVPLKMNGLDVQNSVVTPWFRSVINLRAALRSLRVNTLRYGGVRAGWTWFLLACSGDLGADINADIYCTCLLSSTIHFRRLVSYCRFFFSATIP